MARDLATPSIDGAYPAGIVLALRGRQNARAVARTADQTS